MSQRYTGKSNHARLIGFLILLRFFMITGSLSIGSVGRVVLLRGIKSVCRCMCVFSFCALIEASSVEFVMDSFFLHPTFLGS